MSVALTGCASDSWADPHPSPTAVGDLGDGFWPSVSPAPEATITPSPDSWSEVRPSAGYRVVLIWSGDDAPTQRLVQSVTSWAADEDVDLRTIDVTGDPVDDVTRAIGMKPDLIVSAGNALIDSLTLITADHLDQQFLVVGAELAEPTANVTAVDWKGASFRGEGVGASSSYDASSFTDARCDEAIRVGSASVLHGKTGIVIWLS